MGVRKWMKRMVILDLLLAGMLFFLHMRESAESVHTAAAVYGKIGRAHV